MNIGLRLKKARSKLGLSQSDVCNGIISVTHYSNIESGRYSPSNDTVTFLAERLSLPLEYIKPKENYCPKIEFILTDFLNFLYDEDNNKVSQLIEKNSEDLKYISSYEQEFYYNLLYSHWCYLSNNNFTDFFEKEIKQYMIESIFQSYKTETKGMYYYIEGLYFYTKNNNVESLHSFHKALQNIQTDQMRARLYYNLAFCYYQLFSYLIAKDFAKEAYNLYLHLHNWTKVAGCYNLYAVIHRLLGKLEIAEEYLKKGLDIAEKEQNMILTAILLHNLALVYRDNNKYTLALQTINECIAQKEKTNLNTLLSYNTKLEILFLLEDTEKFKLLLEILKKENMTEVQYSSLIYLEAQMAFVEEDYNTYEKRMISAISFFKKHHVLNSLEKSTLELSHYYENNKQYKKALQYSQLCVSSIKEKQKFWDIIK